MIQLTRNGIRGSSDLDALREEFASTDAVRLPKLLSVDIMARIFELMERGRWIENIHPGISRELLLEDTLALHLLQFVTSAPDFLTVIERIASCAQPTNFQGRIYRMLPGAEHQDSWHDDAGEGRMVGMSINLSPHPYAGGVLQFRRRRTKELLRELPNVISADAILFRISPELEHRVSPVEGVEPKTAFAGWFKTVGIDFLASIRQYPSP